jgi:hypothetical protein
MNKLKYTRGVRKEKPLFAFTNKGMKCITILASPINSAIADLKF